MKRLLVPVLCALLTFSSLAHTKSVGGGSSVSSGGRGGFSSSASVSRPSVSAPAAVPSANRGGFVSSPTPSASTVSRPTTTSTTTRTTTTVNRSYNYSSRYVSPGGYYGGWGMGYGYTNGLLTGMIIANMMHPTGTVMYTGGGTYNNNALLYPNGQVVNQQGYLVGNYINGQFTPVENGGLVAQPVPSDAGAQPVQSPPTQVAQPVVIQNTGPSIGTILLSVLLLLGIVVLIVVLI